MHSILKILVLLSLFFLNTLYSKTIKISVSDNLTPYSLLDKNKETKGLIIDYWTLWAKKVKVDIEFVSSSYLESFSLLKNNKVDFQAGSLYVEDRNSFLDYLAINNKAYLNFFIKRKDNLSIKNVNDLFGKKVAVLKNSYPLAYLKTNYPKIKLKEYNSLLSLYSAINDNNVDAIFSESLTFWHELIKSSDFTSIIKLESFSHRTKIYAGLKKGDKKLRELILKGINNITNEEMSVIENKWIVDESLKYFSKIKKDDILSEKERKYLQENSLITIATLNNWNKYLDKDKNGNYIGYHIDLLKIINNNLGTNFSIKVYESWSKAYSDVKTGKVSSIFGLSSSKKREKIFSFSPNYSTSPRYLIVRKENKNINNIKDINNKTVAVMKDSVVIKVLERKESNIKLIFVKNHLQMLEKVHNKEVDIVLLEGISKEHLKKYELKMIKTIYTKEGELSIGTPIKDKLLSSIMKKAIKSISKEQKEFLNIKWFKKKIDSIFTNEELFYIKNSDFLKVGVDNWKPILFSTNGNDMQGISADILKKITKISGLRFSPYPGEWHTLISKFNKGELDILPDTSFLEERLEYGLFTQSYLHNPNAIFVNKSNSSIKSLKDLEYKTLAIQKDYAAVTKIKRKYPKIIIKEVLNLKESIKLLLNNEIDAFYDFEVNVKYVLDESLISSIKTIFQNEIKNDDISIYSKKDDYLLNSILIKSLSAITINEKQKIINKWINTIKKHKKVNILFGENRAPFTKSYLNGIEYDLLILILNKMNITVDKEIRSSLLDIKQDFKNNKYIDIALTVKKGEDSFYYSDDFISFENTVITRIDDNIIINSIKDLKNKSINSFSGSSKIFGEEFYNLFYSKNTDNKNYKEYKSQEKQVKDFLDKKVNILIIDKNIFKWYLKKLSSSNILDYKYDYIFKGKNNFQVLFRDKNLRDLFNNELLKIKMSGEYQEIIDDYIKYDIKAKKKVNLFISALLAKSIYENDIKEIKKVSKVFLDLSYIKKIEVYSYDNKKLYETSNVNEKKFFAENSFFDVFFTPKHVGYIRVFFDEKYLSLNSSKNKLIPNINKFDTLSIYPYIKTTYKKFSYLNSKINFTNIELEYMKNNPIIRYSETIWEPLVFIDENKDDDGLVSEYKKLIEQKTSLSFKHIKYDKWHEVISSFDKNNIDILLSYNESELDSKRGLLSKKYESFKYVIVTKEDAEFVENIYDLNNKTIALRSNYSVYKFIKKSYPNIKIIKTDSVEEAFKLVSSNKAYATIEHFAISSYKIRDTYSNLKIAGVIDKNYDHHFLIQKDNFVLLSILNKVINNITIDEKNNIRNKWINNYEKVVVNYMIIYELLIVFAFILMIVFFFIRKLKHAKVLIEEQKKNLETLFLDTQDAVILVKNGKYIDVNNSLLELFKYKSKEDFLNNKPSSMAPLYQDNNELSSIEMKKHFEECYKKGTARFEWLAKKSNGELFWMEIVSTKLKFSDEDILHMLCRDISESKTLELELKEQKEVFETLFNESADGVALIKDNKFIDCNNAILNMIDFRKKSDLIGLSILDLSPEYQDNNKLSKVECKIKIDECIKNGWSRFEWIHIKSTGIKMWIEVVLTNITIRYENIIHVVWRDISQTKKLQKQIKQRTTDLENSNEELEETIENLKQTQDQLIASEKMAALGALVAGVAHEINTPVGIGLTGISHLEDITRTITNQYKSSTMTQEDFEEYLKSSKDLSVLIYKNLEKAASLVRSFKQVSVDQSSEEKREFNLKEYLYEILQSIHSVTKRTKIKIKISCDDGIQINSYAGFYSQIITNLIMNSLVHGFKDKEEGNIFINIENKNNELKIIYKDTGIGIKEENINKIFDPFFTTNRDNGGSGLGLNIIYNIITSRLNGSIKCYSEENNGVEFIIILNI